MQPFPSYFHEHYVIGFVERALFCRDREYAIEEGSIVLFNPGDSHACVQSDEREDAGRAVPKKWERRDRICYGGRVGHRDKASGAFIPAGREPAAWHHSEHSGNHGHHAGEADAAV